MVFHLTPSIGVLLVKRKYIRWFGSSLEVINLSNSDVTTDQSSALDSLRTTGALISGPGDLLTWIFDWI